MTTFPSLPMRRKRPGMRKRHLRSWVSLWTSLICVFMLRLVRVAGVCDNPEIITSTVQSPVEYQIYPTGATQSFDVVDFVIENTDCICDYTYSTSSGTLFTAKPGPKVEVSTTDTSLTSEVVEMTCTSGVSPTVMSASTTFSVTYTNCYMDASNTLP